MVETHVERACARVDSELDALDAKREAFETFINRVADVSTEPVAASAAGVTATGETRFHTDGGTDKPCQTVRTAFAETIGPHSVDDIPGDEHLLATIRNEFTDSIAVALAPTTGASFTEDLKQALLSEADSRRTEVAVLRQTLTREASSLADAKDGVEDVTSWIAQAEETPLTELGFDALRERHRRLASHRERCREIARERQEFLQGTTNRSVEVGIRHQSLPSYLYGEFPVEYPVLSTVARLDDACESCQRAVRDHLVRRA